MRDLFARIHNGLAWLVFIGANLAFFLIALSVFAASYTQRPRGRLNSSTSSPPAGVTEKRPREVAL